MSESPALPSAEESAVSSIVSHFNGNRISTELSLYNVLRKDYPDYEIVATTNANCHLLGFVEYGLATATPIHDNNHDISWVYSPATERTKKKNADGKIKNVVRLGLWKYVWDGNEYLYYHIQYASERYGGGKETIIYLLSRKSPVGGNPEATAADATAASKEAKERIDKLLMAVGRWSADVHSEIYVFDNSRWSKDRKLYLSVMGTKWSDIILSPSLKDGIISDITTFFDSEEMYTSLNIPWKRGIILHGTPGNGKTLSIKALINTLQTSERKIPSLYVKSFDNCSHGPKYSIREIFTRARTMAPCLLIFEDLDSLVTAKIRAYFLNEVDGLESNDGICMIGSTNHLNTLDPAIAKRPSRFDRKYHFGLPGPSEREAYCTYWGEKLEGKTTVAMTGEMVTVLAGFTEGFSFAYLKELFLSSLLAVATRTAEELAVGEGAAEEEGSASSDSTVVVETADTVVEGAAGPAGDADKTKTETSPVETKDEKEKEVVKPISEDEIPEELKDNVFFRVLCQQVTSLRREMNDKGDDGKDEAGPGGEPDNGGADEDDSD
ncbi:hypothetical protein V493_05314 [Pseudogymnoascus sp. VKM F-4281 (FW-2241)]|nr:hypothetical protein V493_05314 [Pseudogymnoascus sp. VKM F-4281 (FW-2241)]